MGEGKIESNKKPFGPQKFNDPANVFDKRLLSPKKTSPPQIFCSKFFLALIVFSLNVLKNKIFDEPKFCASKNSIHKVRFFLMLS